MQECHTLFFWLDLGVIKRVVVLLTVLMLRMFVGGVMSECQNKVRVRGRVDEVAWKNEVQVVGIDEFRFEAESGYKEGYKQGDEVVVVGRCERGRRDFWLGRVWLVGAEVKERIGVADKKGLRDRLVEIYEKQLPDPEAGLVAGVVLGHKSSMEESFYDSLIETGTVHVVVASGYNVVVVGTVALNLLVYLMRRQRATVVALMAMVGYGWLAGGEAPVVRAVIMGSFAFVARATGRQTESGWLLVVAGWLMLMIDPELIESVSFQLSLAATAGLIWVEPKIREKMERVKARWVKILMETELSPTLAAQITTAPIVWWNFGRLSLISPLVNILVLPLVPMMMGLGAGQLVLGRLVAPLTYAVAHLFVVVVRWFG